MRARCVAICLESGTERSGVPVMSAHKKGTGTYAPYYE